MGRYLKVLVSLIVKAPWESDPPRKFSWSRQLKRLNLSLNDERWKALVVELEHSNKLLSDTINSRDNQEPIGRRTVKHHDLPSWCSAIPERATNLFNALVASWSCGCPVLHSANLYFEGMAGSQCPDNDSEKLSHRETSFRLWFSTFGNVGKELPWDWHHAKVRSISLPSLKSGTSVQGKCTEPPLSPLPFTKIGSSRTQKRK
jgi:hypothetical protein